MPATRRSRWNSRTPETRRASRGTIFSRNIGFNSRGGPGSSAIIRPFSSIHKPGAVPPGLSSGSAPSGTIACRTFTSGISRPKLRKRPWMARRISSLRCSLRPSRSATASRVRSSSVGPSPPLEITSGTRSSASRNAALNSSRSSPTIVLRTTSMPRRFSSSVRKRELVSSRSGVSSSEPTAMISAFISSKIPRVAGRERPNRG